MPPSGFEAVSPKVSQSASAVTVGSGHSSGRSQEYVPFSMTLPSTRTSILPACSAGTTVSLSALPGSTVTFLDQPFSPRTSNSTGYLEIEPSLLSETVTVPSQAEAKVDAG